ncbi:iron-sulfur cluster assembly scaffold protein [Candidatus Woesebacteria bacterium]|nr:iron-sulfur cluster assembly scaffold protein [Candidatus Woesebacteria bacterium]
MSDIYQELILDEYKHQHNKGVLVGADMTMSKTNASCGDDVTVYIQLSEDAQCISDLKWEGNGCVISQVAVSKLSEHLKGKTIAEVQKMNQSTLLDLLGLPEISSGREHCLLIGLQAVQKAMGSM